MGIFQARPLSLTRRMQEVADRGEEEEEEEAVMGLHTQTENRTVVDEGVAVAAEVEAIEIEGQTTTQLL